MVSTAYIINHTHWDREWFLTSVYTSRWIPGLIDALERRTVANPFFTYFLDGQTLVLEDLAQISPEHLEKAAHLVQAGRLIIGPYYCQPDWQLTGGELLVRNLMYGQRDVDRYGGSRHGELGTGWLVDAFGHNSQSPQIHSLFGVQAVYVWRGVPELEPYFHWVGADGSRLLTLYLLGGYRNLYGVTHVPQVAAHRLHTEMDKLAQFYPTPDIPLFDGYDLEDNPEDPVTFYTGLPEVRGDIHIQETDPARFAHTVAEMQLPLPMISGELNSGKYGATFPGTLSARDYIKVMAYDCAHLLYQRCEPLGVMAYLHGRDYPDARYEAWGRTLLQNAVHDCICGVSIDQVHEKMELIYRQVFDEMRVDLQSSLDAIMGGFQPGLYAVSTSPFELETWTPLGGRLYHTRTFGVGIWPVEESLPVQNLNLEMESFAWSNDHYSAAIEPDGKLHINAGQYGCLVVSRENGDSYSCEMGERLGMLEVVGSLTLVEKSEQHCIVSFFCRWQNPGKNEWAEADVRLCFDLSPIVRWQIDLETRGAGLRVEMVFETGIPGECWAGMQFDLVKRPLIDRDLLPLQVSPELQGILLGQRELGEVNTFPFHDLLCISDSESANAIFAKGIHAYSADGAGTVKLILRRAVEWLTRSDLHGRLGDAGPFFYVPDGRCERKVLHEAALLVGATASPSSIELYARLAAYQDPPLIVHGQGSGLGGEGLARSWQLLHEALPLSSLAIYKDQVLARLYNPSLQPHNLNQDYLETNVWGEARENVVEIGPKKITTVRLEHPRKLSVPSEPVHLLTSPTLRSGSNAGRPDPRLLDLLVEKIAHLEQETTACQAGLASAHGADYLQLLHRYYVLKRESLEYQLSLLLNRRKLAEPVGEPRYEYLFEVDDEIAALGLELNQLRMKRRIFDYIVI